MGFAWQWDEEREVLLVLIRGPIVGNPESQEAATRLLASNHWRGGRVLFDIRNIDATGVPRYPQLSMRVARWMAEQGVPSAVAILANAGANYGVARELAALGETRVARIAVFENEDEALVWLAGAGAAAASPGGSGE